MQTASYPSQLRCRIFMSTGIYSMICFLLRACKLFEYCTFRAKHQTFSLNSLNHKRPMFDSNYGEIDLNVLRSSNSWFDNKGQIEMTLGIIYCFILVITHSYITNYCHASTNCFIIMKYISALISLLRSIVLLTQHPELLLNFN